MIVDMGAAIILLMKKWVNAQQLIVKERVAESISGAKATAVLIEGTTSMTLFLAPTLELDIASIVVCLGDFYQGLLRCTLLCGQSEAAQCSHHLAWARLMSCY